jgi:hypothetical protein
MSIPTITGSTFNFTGEYFPPTWSGTIHLYTFGVVFPTVRQIWADNDYVFAACAEGLNIIDVASEKQYSFITYSGGFTTVWANENKVFLGTATSGIKYIDKSCIIGNINLPSELTCLSDYAIVPRLRSNTIRYIHGRDNLIVCCTASGVQSLGIYGYESETLTPAAWKCFMTSSTAIYYTTSGVSWAVNKVNSSLTDWTVPHITYSGDGFSAIPIGARINDIFVTEGTSSAGTKFNTIFIATTSGACIIDDGTDVGVVYLTY